MAVLHSLLQAGADKDSVDNYGYIALMLASEKSHVDIFRTLSKPFETFRILLSPRG